MKRCGLLILCLILCLVVPAQDTIALVGCGSVIPKGLYGVWANAYMQRNPRVRITYLPYGSKEGIKQITEGAADFGGGEIPITNAEMKATGKTILQFPLFLTAVVPVYNVPGTSRPLRFSGKVLADIYMGKIKSWNHPDLARLNPGVSLPNLAISAYHREPGKGTTYLFTDFLSRTNPSFRSLVGTDSSPAWPGGKEAQGGETLVRQVKATEGAIGYAELNTAQAGGVSIGQVQNLSGAFLTATPEGAAAACPRNLSRDFRVSLTNMPGANAYPITGLTWMFVPAEGATPTRAQALNSFVKFIFTDGQPMIEAQGHIPLPSQVVSAILERL
ncbi:MAG TPA: phosphate ABC transporter substrate-binding protein PstS [Verrucomicrobiae bacterium]|jgi:phosphate transport system substrate-binding protein|nr:phosphate ABC transporter substrate-binding protein PstS [Verrucomicrobiae bacterium]